MVNSSETVLSSDSSSVSLSETRETRPTRAKPKVKHARRTKLVNTSLKKSNTLFLYANMHAGIFTDTLETKCSTRKSPFDVLFRYIYSAPGETTMESERTTSEFATALNNDFENDTLTPNNIATILKSHKNTNDLNPLELSQDGTQNFGFEKRNQTVINYKDTPYCLKTYEFDKKGIVNGTDINNNGIYCLNTVKNGWKAPINILFDKKFIAWVKKNCTEGDHTRQKKSTYQVKQLDDGTEYILFLTNDIFFNYISQELKIKRVFFVDNSCDSDYWGNLPTNVPKNLTFKPNRELLITKIETKLDDINDKMLKVVEKILGIQVGPDENIYNIFLQHISKFSANAKKLLNSYKTQKDALEEQKRNLEDSNSEAFEDVYKAQTDVREYANKKEALEELADVRDFLKDDCFTFVEGKLGPAEHTLVLYKYFVLPNEAIFSKLRPTIEKIKSDTENTINSETVGDNYETMLGMVEDKIPSYLSKYPDIFEDYKDRFSKEEIKGIKYLKDQIKRLENLEATPLPTSDEKRKTIRDKKKVYYDKMKKYHPELRKTKKFQGNAKKNKGTWGIIKGRTR